MMKLDWIAKTALLLAPVYPAVLLFVSRPHWAADAALALVYVTLVVLAIVAFAQGKHRQSPSAIFALVFVEFLDGFLNDLNEMAWSYLTVLAGFAAASMLFAFVASLWREKRKRNGIGGAAPQ
jgi:ABC-type multidrug transport system fused ATPase/permease subunit